MTSMNPTFAMTIVSRKVEGKLEGPDLSDVKMEIRSSDVGVEVMLVKRH